MPAAVKEPVRRWAWTSRPMLNMASGRRAMIESVSMREKLRSTGADTSATFGVVDGTSHSVELLLSVDRDGRHTLGAQIEEQLRAAVRTGAVRPGAEVPSTLDLARQLGISRRVAVEAYAQLTAEGYLSMRQGARPRVSETAFRAPATAWPAGAARGAGAPAGAAHGAGAPEGAAHPAGAPRGAARGAGASEGAAHGTGAPRGAARGAGASEGAAHGAGAPRG